jgi:SPX domain protein involved in polyphosphate accumulation
VARLPTRVESKFLLTPEQFDAILPEIRERLPGDRNAIEAAYPIVSLYYENTFLDCHWERVKRLANRRKLRVRIYGSTNGAIPPRAFAEVKHKAYGRGTKRRFPLPVEKVMAPDFDLARVLREEAPGRKRLHRVLAEEMLDLLEERGMRPLCLMRYERLAYEDSEDEEGVRITFDAALTCRMDLIPLEPDCRRIDLPVIPPDVRVFEVKMPEVAPYWVRDLVGHHRLVRQRFSKYCTAIEQYHPLARRAAQAAAAPASAAPAAA